MLKTADFLQSFTTLFCLIGVFLWFILRFWYCLRLFQGLSPLIFSRALQVLLLRPPSVVPRYLHLQHRPLFGVIPVYELTVKTEKTMLEKKCALGHRKCFQLCLIRVDLWNSMIAWNRFFVNQVDPSRAGVRKDSHTGRTLR